MAQIGDIVRYLNSVGGGRITRIDGNMAYVDDDGFETPVLIRECVVISHASENRNPQNDIAPSKEATDCTSKSKAAPSGSNVIPEPELRIEETPEGDVINLVLAYEPQDRKNPATSAIDTYLVNDSNYYITFAYMAKANDSESWHTIYAGTVEPNIQLFISELDRTELPGMDSIAIQFIAFKHDKDFKLIKPESVELAVDTSKFFKHHCYRENVYFDKPVIALDIVKDGVPQNRKQFKPDAKELQNGIMAKTRMDMPVRRQVQKHRKKAVEQGGRLVVDLHIHELIDDTRGLSNADMLNMQVDEFRKVMDENLRHKGLKIIFIHGKGEGVLRQALLKELNHRYKGHDVQDASFSEYGYGATQVTI